MFDIRKIQEQVIYNAVKAESNEETAQQIVFCHEENNPLWVKNTMKRLEENFDYTTHEKLKEAIEKQLFEERRDTIKLTIASRSPDTEQLRKLNEVIETLVTREG